MKTPALKTAFDKLTINGVAACCAVSYPAAYKWAQKGRLPRTEWTGETDYATKIATAMQQAGVAMQRDDLLKLHAAESVQPWGVS